jgi:hypothetical protein
MKTKLCSKCGKEKPLNQFNKGNDKNGLSYWCKKCINKHNKKHYQKNKEKILEQVKEYQQIHKEEIKKYQQTHKEKRKKQHKIWCDKNKKEIKKYRKSHKKEINQWTVNKRKTDINFKLAGNLRSRMGIVLKKDIKSASTMKLLGCNIEFLKEHLKKQFKSDMSWDSWGGGYNGKGMQEWHIDHIKPLASFDLSKPSEQKKAFHYTNLQPLWAVENLKKRDKI